MFHEYSENVQDVARDGFAKNLRLSDRVVQDSEAPIVGQLDGGVGREEESDNLFSSVAAG